jgi:hypothetical protein
MSCPASRGGVSGVPESIKLRLTPASCGCSTQTPAIQMLLSGQLSQVVLVFSLVVSSGSQLEHAANKEIAEQKIT